MNKITPTKCYEDFGVDLDGCSRQENEGCNGCKCQIEQDTPITKIEETTSELKKLLVDYYLRWVK